MKGQDFFGRNVEVADESTQMARNSEMLSSIAWSPQEVMFVGRRLPSCLASYGHEPRRFVVYCKYGNSATGFISNITFHSSLGGKYGALSQMGQIYEELEDP